VIGWLMAVAGLLSLAAIFLFSGGVGAGGRRTSPKAALAAANEENRRLREQITELQAEINPIPTFEEIAAADAADTLPKFDQAAPAFVLGAQPCRPDPVPLIKPHLLTELVTPDPEATQSLGVAALRAAAAMDAGETQVMPVAEVRNAVVSVPPLRDPLPPVTWGRTKDAETAQIEAALSIPAPPPGAGASEISMAAGLAAVTKVHATVTGPAQ
jgi:hypothetical protein